MQIDPLPDSAGPIVNLLNGTMVNQEWWATLVPTTWDERTQTFDGLSWYSPSCSEESLDDPEIWPVSAKKSRKSTIIHAGPAAKLAGKRPPRWPGSVALLDGTVHTYCVDGVLNGRPGYAIWLNPTEGIAPQDIERHGTELVAGLL